MGILFTILFTENDPLGSFKYLFIDQIYTVIIQTHLLRCENTHDPFNSESLTTHLYST